MALEDGLAFGAAPIAQAPASEQLSAAGPKENGGSSGGLPLAAAGEKASLDGLQILVVEDEFLLAMEVEATLISFGCSVVGPFAKLAKAIAAAGKAALDAAVLDINLNGEMVYPLADLLHGQGVPFVFLTGYAASDIPQRFRGFRRLQKPLHPYTLRGTLLDLRRGPQPPVA